ncbi:hypothetical protein BX600DRAFT_251014 [Xylariales sp. PMI_506]|nr:hypothetical protein BX600DRAFT_251014 [Xylariales sp. PMI_506]
MQFKTFALSLLVAAVSADEITSLVASIPSCALTCLITGVSSVNCAATDYTCQCTNAAALQAAVSPCIAAGCNATDAATAEEISLEICADLGISANSTSSSNSTSTSNSTATTTSTTTSASATTSKNAAAGRYEFGMLAGAVAAVAAFAL